VQVGVAVSLRSGPVSKVYPGHISVELLAGALKMEALCFFETLVSTYPQVLQRRRLEDLHKCNFNWPDVSCYCCILVFRMPVSKNFAYVNYV
jgi:hypothetical protein